MGGPMLNTLATAQRLTQAGMPREQAEALTLAINEGLTNTAATKDDLTATEQTLRSEIKATEQTLRGEIKTTEQRLEAKIQSTTSNLKISMLKWMFAMFLAQTTVIVGIMAVLLKG